MRYLIVFSALLLTVNALPRCAAGQNSAATTLTPTPPTATVGSAVGLAATVQPTNPTIALGKAFAKPTGTINFLDGTTPLSSTQTALAPSTFGSATFRQVFGTPDPTFTAATIFTTGELTGDLNGDGVADLLVYRELNPNPAQFAAQAFISNGKGGYAPAALQTLNFNGFSQYPAVTIVPVLMDVNGDGKLDLLAGIQVAYGNGDGTFAAPVSVSFLSTGFATSYAADLNGDGKTDILAVNSTSFSGRQFSVTVFLNAGGGSFTSSGTTLIGSGGMATIFVYQPAFLDLNGDGKLDLILQWSTTDAGAPAISVLLNNGDGTLGSPTEFFVTYPANIAESGTSYQTGSGDVNGDGKQDLILVLSDNNGNSSAITLLGNGDGTFASPLYFAFSNSLSNPAVVVQDVNLDGKLDLVFGNGQLGLGTGDGTYTLGTPLFSLPTYPYPLVQITLPKNLIQSLVYLSLSVTPPPAAVYTPQTSSSAAVSLTALAVGTHSITAKYSGDTNYPADTSAAVTVTINQAASATGATSSANPSFAGQSVTFTANLSSIGPTPTGNVTFTSGSTTLATVALSGGSAAYTTTSLTTLGTQMITASYSGDANTQASSATVSQVVNAAFALTPGAGSTTTLTVQSGQTVSAPINITGTAGFSGSVTFSCSSLPANASCSFSPATIAVSGPPAVPTLLSVNTAGSATVSPMTQDEHRGVSAVAYGFSLAGLVLFWPIRRRWRRLGAMVLCIFAFTLLALNGCSGGASGSNAAKTEPGTYNFTVTATSGKVQVQSADTLVVQ